jgi:hypothetical protein
MIFELLPQLGRYFAGRKHNPSVWYTVPERNLAPIETARDGDEDSGNSRRQE